MKKIFTAILFLLMLSHITLYAQDKQVGYATKAKRDSSHQAYFSKEVKEVPFIFEGTVLESKPVQVMKGNKIVKCMQQIIKVHKVFKGNLVCGTVKIITKAKAIRKQPGIYPPGYSAIYFCTRNILPDTNATLISANNTVVLTTSSYILYGGNGYTGIFCSALGISGTPILIFGSYNQIYNRILQEPNIQVAKCDSFDLNKIHDSASKAYHYKMQHSHPYPSDTIKKNHHNLNPPANNNPTKGPNNQDDNFQYLPSYYEGCGMNNNSIINL